MQKLISSFMVSLNGKKNVKIIPGGSFHHARDQEYAFLVIDVSFLIYLE